MEDSEKQLFYRVLAVTFEFKKLNKYYIMYLLKGGNTLHKIHKIGLENSKIGQMVIYYF